MSDDVTEVRTGTTATIPVKRLLRPRSIAIVGVSPESNSYGASALASLENFGYTGQVHLVSRGREEVLGRPCVPRIDDLPSGIDAALLCLPRSAIVDAVAACGRRQIGGAVVFASGFAEAGGEGLIEQRTLADVARKSGVALLGPNCLGFTNFVDRIPMRMGLVRPVTMPNPCVGLVAQSGAMMSAIMASVVAHGTGISHAISTGNEAVIGVEDLIAELLDDEATRVITLFVEHIGRPSLFLELAARARDQKKPIILFHSGRSSAARASALSHTGALAGDYATMKALVSREGVIVVESFDELVDVTALSSRYPEPPTEGIGIVTNSGAFRGIAFDVSETVGLAVPQLSERTLQTLGELLPDFVKPENPLDLSTLLMRDPSLLGSASRAILQDHAIGSLLVAVVPGTPKQAIEKAEAAIPVLDAAPKPTAFAVIGGDASPPAECLRLFENSRTVFFRSPERALRAFAHVTAYGASLEACRTRKQPCDVGCGFSEPGPVSEYRAKRYLRTLGISVPAGELAKDVNAACAAAGRIGFPVAMKAQASALTHKSEAGGVVLNVADEQQLRHAWSQLFRATSEGLGLVLDGVLIERMIDGGIEMIVGARRDPSWGPVVVVGLGGVWTEVLNDVQLLAVDADESEIERAVHRLRGAKLLSGLRGKPASDRAALADAIGRLSAAMRASPQVADIEINPLVVLPDGCGVIALDALIVVQQDESSL